MAKTVSVIHRQRINTAAAWAAANPVLASGQIGVVSDTTPMSLKIGNGSTTWNSLPFVVDGEAIASLINFLSGYNTATTLANLPVTKRSIRVNLNANSTLSISGTLPQGRELHIKVYNTGATARTLTLPTTGSFESKKNDNSNISSVTLPANGNVEISILAINEKYVIKTDV